MTTIPRSVVNARRTAGGLLLVSSLIVLIAFAFIVVGYVNKPPTVRVLSGTASPTVPGPGGGGGVATLSASSDPAPTVQSSAEGPPSPAPLDPLDQLKAQAAADSGSVAVIPDGWWVPQIDSKTDGIVVDNVPWDNQMILNDHQSMRNSYPGSALLWSSDYRSFEPEDYWVTIVAAAYSASPGEALAWCSNAALDNDHCFARRISVGGGYSPNESHPQ